MEVKSVTEALFFTTVKISTWNHAGLEGSGTGFIFQLERDGQNYPLLVTNKHVVDGSTKAAIRVHRSNGERPALGDSVEVTLDAPDWAAMWHGHPDPAVDITVAAFGPILNQLTKAGIQPFYRAISPRDIPSAKQIEDLDALEEVTFVGYPNGIWDAVNALPVLRRGTTASPLQVDFEGTPRFIIDASVFGGSSGSPVFIANTGGYSEKNGNFTVGNRFYFLGVVAAVFQRTALNEIISVPIPTSTRPVAVQQEMLDLGIVFKSRTVMEAVDHWHEHRIKPLLPK